MTDEVTKPEVAALAAVVAAAPKPAPNVHTSEFAAIIAKWEHDIVGKAHFIVDEIRALIAKIEAAV